jgi:hypothetical protein
MAENLGSDDQLLTTRGGSGSSPASRRGSSCEYLHTGGLRRCQSVCC